MVYQVTEDFGDCSRKLKNDGRLGMLLPKSKSRHRLAAGTFVRVRSVLSGLHHEYSLAVA